MLYDYLWYDFCVLVQLQSMQQWKQSVEQKLAAVAQSVSAPQISSPSLYKVASPVVASNPPNTGVSFPDSGFESTSDHQAAQEDSFLSSGTTDSLKTVRALSPVQSGFATGSDAADSADCSLLEEYLSSVQQREEEAEVNSDRTETPQPSSPASPSRTTNSPPTQKEKETIDPV